MLAFLLHHENVIFTAALFIMVCLGFIELASVFLGGLFSDVIDSLLPDIDVDADVDGGGHPILAWLHIGRVPTLILIIMLLLFFGVTGWAIQWFSLEWFGAWQQGSLMIYPALLVALVLVHLCGGYFARLTTVDQTDAVNEEDFIGSAVEITLGEATFGSPAEAKLVDRFGQTHYVMVEPVEKNMQYGVNATLVIVARKGAVFQVCHTDI